MENNVRSIDTVLDEDGLVHPKGSGFGGKYTKLPSEYRKKLSKALPKEAIKKHPTKTFLSTIKAIFIVERMNDVFGIDGWNLEHEIVNDTHTISSKDGDLPYIVMKGRIYIRKYDLYTPYQYGGHQMAGKGTEPADGYKSAVTDLQSKCASYLEIGIQVFKGVPLSQVANESKVDDEPKQISPKEFDEGAKNMEKKVVKETPKKTAKKTARKSIAKVASGMLEEPKKVEPKPIPKEALEAEKKVSEICDEAEFAENVDIMKPHYDEIAAYLDANELKEQASVIVFNATVDGATPEELKELKDAINSKYKELKG